MTGPTPAAERLEELFAASLIFGLTADERVEFLELRAQHPSVDLQPIAEVIASLDEHHPALKDMPLPLHLRERILADAQRILPLAQSQHAGSGRTRSSNRLPWAISAVCASVMLVAVATAWMLWQGRLPGDPTLQREQLIASAHDLIQIPWADGPTPMPGAQGDISWSTSEQRGFMQFRGMRANNPTVEQYQLWIFDRNQDEKTPVDGGVFNIPSDGEVVVPIKPGLQIREPYLFAITIEKPGGVVVSDRSRLPLLAAVTP